MNPRPPNVNPIRQAKAARRIAFAMKGLSPETILAKIAEYPEHGREFYAAEFGVTPPNMGRWLRRLAETGDIKCHKKKDREIVYYPPNYTPRSTPLNPNPIEEIFALMGTVSHSQADVFKASKYGSYLTQKMLRELTEAGRIEKVMIDKVHVAYRRKE